MPLSEVAAKGNYLASLKALRDRLAADLDTSGSLRDTATLAARFMEVLTKIAEAEKAEPEKAGTALDELAKRRKAAGRPNATGSTRAPRTTNRG